MVTNEFVTLVWHFHGTNKKKGPSWVTAATVERNTVGRRMQIPNRWGYIVECKIRPIQCVYSVQIPSSLHHPRAIPLTTFNP